MKTDLNFYVSYRMTNRHMAMKSKASYLITALIIVTVALIGGVTLFLVALNITDGIRITELSVEKASYALQVQKYNQINSELGKIKTKETSISNVIANIQSHRMLTNKELTAVYAVMPADVVIKQANYMNSILVMECSGTSKDSPSLAAEKLSKQGIPTTVTYTGFKSAKAEAAETISFTVVCLLGEVE